MSWGRVSGENFEGRVKKPHGDLVPQSAGVVGPMRTSWCVQRQPLCSGCDLAGWTLVRVGQWGCLERVSVGYLSPFHQTVATEVATPRIFSVRTRWCVQRQPLCSGCDLTGRTLVRVGQWRVPGEVSWAQRPTQPTTPHNPEQALLYLPFYPLLPSTHTHPTIFIFTQVSGPWVFGLEFLFVFAEMAHAWR